MSKCRKAGNANSRILKLIFIDFQPNNNCQSECNYRDHQRKEKRKRALPINIISSVSLLRISTFYSL